MREKNRIQWVKSCLLYSLCMASFAGVTPATYNVYVGSNSGEQQTLSLNNSNDTPVAIRARLYKKVEGHSIPYTVTKADSAVVRFSPQRLLIPAHASGRIILTYHGEPRQVADEYSLEIIPLGTKRLGSAARSDQPYQDASSLSFLTTQQVNVHILPQHVRPNMALRYEQDHAILQNTGNVSLLLDSLHSCRDKTTCYPLSKYAHIRFFPGAKLNIGPVADSSSFLVKTIWGNHIGKEEHQTLHLS